MPALQQCIQPLGERAGESLHIYLETTTPFAKALKAEQSLVRS